MDRVLLILQVLNLRYVSDGFDGLLFHNFLCVVYFIGNPESMINLYCGLFSFVSTVIHLYHSFLYT